MNVCMSLLLMIGLLGAAPAVAKGIDLKGIEPLQPVEYMPEAEFLDKTKKTDETPFGDLYLEYKMRLPRDWTRTVDPPKATPDATMKRMSDRVLGVIGEYISPPTFESRSYISIEALELDHEINARNWFVNFILSEGYAPTAMTEVSEQEVQAIYVDVQGDTSFIVRLKAIVNGPRVVLFRYYMPQENVATERVMQAQVVKSFRLVNPETATIESRKTFAFLDQSFFDYPASWTAESPRLRSIDRMRAQLYTGVRRNAPDGQVTIHTISRLLDTTLADEVKAYRQKLKIPGFTLGQMIEKIQYSNTDPSMEFSATEVYRLEPEDTKMRGYELAISVMKGSEYFYIMTLITHAREEDFYQWARNMRAFRIMAETMRRFNDGGDDDRPEAPDTPPPAAPRTAP